MRQHQGHHPKAPSPGFIAGASGLALPTTGRATVRNAHEGREQGVDHMGSDPDYERHERERAARARGIRGETAVVHLRKPAKALFLQRFIARPALLTSPTPLAR